MSKPISRITASSERPELVGQWVDEDYNIVSAPTERLPPIIRAMERDLETAREAESKRSGALIVIVCIGILVAILFGAWAADPAGQAAIEGGRDAVKFIESLKQ